MLSSKCKLKINFIESRGSRMGGPLSERALFSAGTAVTIASTGLLQGLPNAGLGL
jgi:hypothetical protein